MNGDLFGVWKEKEGAGVNNLEQNIFESKYFKFTDLLEPIENYGKTMFHKGGFNQGEIMVLMENPHGSGEEQFDRMQAWNNACVQTEGTILLQTAQ